MIVEKDASVKVSISLTKAQDDYVRELIASGRYASYSSVVQDAIRMHMDDCERKKTITPPVDEAKVS
ncbi:MAG: hypothetical protein WC683_07310 [bacterium]